MAPTIRIKREDAIKALQDRLATVMNENTALLNAQVRYEEDVKLYRANIKNLVVQQITKNPIGNMVDAYIISAGDYDSDLGQRRSNTAFRVVVDTTGIKTLPKKPEKPQGKVHDIARIERQIHLLTLATDDTVPVSLFKDLQDLL